MTLIDDYFEYHKKYTKIYGKNTILLFEVGSFYELYSKLDENNEYIVNIKEICELLNIQFTRKNKNIEHSPSNPYMAGFPSFVLSKYIDILLKKYTIILYEQTTPPPNPKREITQIISKGTYIDSIKNSDNNYIFGIILEKNIYKNKCNYILACTIIDYSTGIIKLYQQQFLNSNVQIVYENIYRILESYNPSEILFHHTELNNDEQRFIKTNLDIDNRLLHIYNEDINKEYFKLNYQNEFLNKIYHIKSFTTPIEYLNLEYYQYSIVSFILLLNFTENHNKSIIQNLNKPQIINENDELILYNDAIYQLNVLHHYKHSKINSLYDILNKYIVTSIGKRYLKDRLLHPITDINKLNNYYDSIESCLNMENIINYNEILKEICDIERCQRKMALNNISPYEYYNLHNSYECILKLWEIINNTLKKFINNNDIINKLQELINENNEVFNFEELSKYNNQNLIETNIFNEGKYNEIDNYYEELNNIFVQINKESLKLSNLIEKNSDMIKYDSTDKEGYYFTTTLKRYESIKNKNEIKEYKVKKNNNSVKLFSDTLKKQSNKILYLKENIKKESKKIFTEIINNNYVKYNMIFNDLVCFIGNVDLSVNNAKLSLELNYSKPIINEKEDSYINFKELRHPIIEYISGDKYIDNDVSLGNENNNGILLYGINAVGKSSLSKSIALNIILAQSGLFVSCSSMTYSPYHHIFTRINSNDNLFKNQSTFVVEMMELKSILKFCDNHSLMIGDEICKGSEENSALSLLTCTIKKMNIKKTNFILATHFHQLYEKNELLQDINISFKHLSVEFNENNIIYNRKLKDGVGDNLYGLEVAKFILDDIEFMNDCYEIRNILLNKSDNNILTPKKSNYNNEVYMNSCNICGCKDNLDTHHIKEQHLFSEYVYEKNKKDNLVVLCKKHHDEVHHGKLIIKGYLTTTEGKKLDYCYNEEIIKTNKKYSINDINLIKSINDNKKTKKVIIKELKDKHNIKISISTFNKIINNTY